MRSSNDAQPQQNTGRAVSPAAQGESDFPSGTLGVEERQPSSAQSGGRALTQELMEQVVDPDNLNRAYVRVRANKGAPGIDGMTVEELGEWPRERKEAMIAALLDGSYRPQPVKGVQIPKPDGGMRQLGIPTVADRLVQQAIRYVLEPLLGGGHDAGRAVLGADGGDAAGRTALATVVEPSA